MSESGAARPSLLLHPPGPGRPPLTMKRTPLNRVSKKRQQLLRKRSAFRKDLLAANPRCVVCHDHWACDVHEPLTRARGGSILDPDNAVGVCRGCHDWIHDHPEEATRKGLLRSQHD